MFYHYTTGLSAFLVNFGHWCPVKFGKPCMPHISSYIYICTYSYRFKGRNWWGGKWPSVQRDAPPFPLYIYSHAFLFSLQVFTLGELEDPTGRCL
jgi:hypothetical protein